MQALPARVAPAQRNARSAQRGKRPALRACISIASSESASVQQPPPPADRHAAARATLVGVLAGVALSCQLALSPVAAAAAAAPEATTDSGTAAAAAAAPSTAAVAPAGITLQPGGTVRYSEFEALIRSGAARVVLLSPAGEQAGALQADGRVVATEMNGVATPSELVELCKENNVEVIVAANRAEFEASVPSAVSPLLRVARLVGFALVPTVMVGAAIILGLRLLRGGAAGGLPNALSSFLRLRGEGVAAAKSTVRFSDVAGVEGAKQELREVVDFLKDSDKYGRLGAKVPRGVLLTGPPGTGKTLLAKAVAGEAGVPFFSVAASEFVEVFVGVGASRVRDLFDKAKKAAPCIIFIDELDAVGRQRGTGIGGGSDEREQTINQLLNEMDGFEGNTGVIVLSATNREDVLDSALLRPGRFDRRINVELPDLEGRLAILRIHARNKPLGPDVDLRNLARRTPGFSGADLQNLMNEAAIMAARHGKALIGAEEASEALEKISLGPEKASAMTTPEKKALVAYHEAGHAIVGALMPEYDRVEKISIIPRGRAGGATLFTPDEDRLSAGFFSRNYLLSQLSVALGGRAAEEVVYGAAAVTTGAADDLRAVTRTARAMVEVAGLSRRFTHAALRARDGPAFLGATAGADTGIAAATADEAAAEVQAIVAEAYDRARQLLSDNIAVLHRLAMRLVERETLDGAEVEAMLAEEGARTCADLRVAAGAVSVAGGNGPSVTR